mgnify:CR=1 FL=1
MVKRNVDNKIIELQPVLLENSGITIYVRADIIHTRCNSEKESVSMQTENSSAEQLQTMGIF